MAEKKVLIGFKVDTAELKRGMAAGTKIVNTSMKSISKDTSKGMDGMQDKMKGLLGGTGKLGGALRGLSSIIGVTPYGLAARALGALGTATVAWFMTLDKKKDVLTTATNNLNSFITATKTAEENATKEIATAQTLLSIAKDETIEKGLRLSAIEKLNKIAPETLGHLTLENINTQTGINLTKEYTDEILRNAKAKAYAGEIEKGWAEVIKEQLILDKIVESRKKAGTIGAHGEKKRIDTGEGGGKFEDDLQNAQNTIKKATEERLRLAKSKIDYFTDKIKEESTKGRVSIYEDPKGDKKELDAYVKQQEKLAREKLAADRKIQQAKKASDKLHKGEYKDLDKLYGETNLEPIGLPATVNITENNYLKDKAKFEKKIVTSPIVLPVNFKNMAATTTSAWDGILAGMEVGGAQLAADMEQMLRNIGQAIRSTIETVFGNIGESLGAGIANVISDKEDPFADWGDMVIKSLLAVAKQIGGLLITMGTGMLLGGVTTAQGLAMIAGGMMLVGLSSYGSQRKINNNADKTEGSSGSFGSGSVGTLNYAEGGIVGGAMYSGDRVNAMVNSGEMILNARQQGNLFSMIQSGISSNGGGGVLTHRISGNDLLIIMDRATKTRGRTI